MTRSLLILGLFITTLQLHAQKDWNFGFHTMGQITMLLNQADTDSGAVRYVTSYGGGGGADLHYFWHSKWGVGTGVDYSIQGQKKDYGLNDSTFVDAFNTVELHYLKFPFTIRYRTDSDVRFSYNAAFGPTVMALMRARRIYERSQFYAYVEGDVKDEYSALNWGLFMSHGVAYRVGKKILLTMDFYGDWALSDAEKKDAAVYDFLNDVTTVYPEDRPKTHNVVLGAAIGLEIPLGASNTVVRNR